VTGGESMGEYEQFLQEKNQIDYLLKKGFSFYKVSENLSGAIVEFRKSDHEQELVHVLTPNGRKYFSALLLQQQVTNKK